MKWMLPILMFSMLATFSCVKDVDTPNTYGVTEGAYGAAFAYGGKSVTPYVIVDVVPEDGTVTEDTTTTETGGEDTAVADTGECTGTEDYCACMPVYNNSGYCNCIEGIDDESAKTSCKCEHLICVPEAEQNATEVGLYLSDCYTYFANTVCAGYFE